MRISVRFEEEDCSCDAAVFCSLSLHETLCKHFEGRFAALLSASKRFL